MNHSELVQGLTKSGKNIAIEMTKSKAHIIHMALGIAGVAGILAALLASKYMKPQKQIVTKEIGTVQVLVAKKEINVGDSITRAHLGWKAWPKTASSQQRPNGSCACPSSIAPAPPCSA